MKRTTILSVFGVVFLTIGCAKSDAPGAEEAAAAKKVYGEWRIRLRPESEADYNKLIEEQGLALYTEAGGRLMGWWHAYAGGPQEQVTIWEFDEAFVAPRGGFADALDYYAQSSAIHRLDAIRVPTLVIHALDDPWIPVRSYRDRDWSEDSAARLLLAPGGGHVGFHGRGSPIPWHDRCIQLFFDGLCGAEVAGEPRATGLVGADGS